MTPPAPGDYSSGMSFKRLARFLRRAPLLLPLLLAACATSDGMGPSQERTYDLLALAAGSAMLVVFGALMYVDNRD